MKIDEIFSEWEKDSNIDKSELAQASLDIPLLHGRWLRRYLDEKLLLFKIRQEFQRLSLRKYEWLLGGETKESRALEWTFPARGVPLKSDIQKYLDADPQMQEILARFTIQEEKVKALESIVNQINWRHNVIKNAIEDTKFKQGL